jgi:hypothetical protein
MKAWMKMKTRVIGDTNLDAAVPLPGWFYIILIGMMPPCLFH